MSLHIPQLIVVLMLTVSFSATAADDAAAPVKVSGKTMGTYFVITISELPDGISEDQIATAMNLRLDTINQQMSTWIPDSEISRFNMLSTSDWFPVSEEFIEVTQEAKRIYDLTGGAFDPTVSPVVDLWGFGDKRPKKMPDDEQINAALSSIGMKYIELRTKPPAVRKSKPDVQLNFSAIAKGYAVDDLASTLKNMQLTSFLVDIGGETRAGGAKPDGSPWKLGIESPQGGLQQIVSLTNESIATSGDYRNFFEIDGQKYSHAINPISGRPTVDPPASVSVRHASCMTADAFATGMMVMDQDKAIQLAKTEGLSVLFQRINDGQEIETIGTGSFQTDPEASDEVKPARSMMWVPFVAAAALFLLAVGGMSLGTMIQNRQIKGSCGGLASMPGHDGTSACDMCSIPRDQCSNEEVRERIKAMAEESLQANGEKV